MLRHQIINNVIFVFQFNMMEQMHAANRPQNSGVILLSVGTFFFLTVTFQLAALHPVEAGK